MERPLQLSPHISVGLPNPRFRLVSRDCGARPPGPELQHTGGRDHQSNRDVVGNNTPVFFHRDPLNPPDLNRAVKRDPRTNMRDPENNWGFWTNLPESLHQVTITMSDRGIPKSSGTCTATAHTPTA